MSTTIEAKTPHSPFALAVPRTSQPGEPAWEVAMLFPFQGDWTEEEYLGLDTSRLVELSDGCIEVLPMATIFHQLIVRFLARLLETFVAGRHKGVVLVAPLPVHLWKGKFREPDIIYFLPHRVKDVHGQPEGADLVVEVVSGGEENRKRDLVTKRQEYAEAGITEYWMVDPQERQITVLVLDGQTYREHGIFGPGAAATSVLLRGFTASVDAVFAAGQAHQ
jgi:Uma2 family endonuclease